jgi:hypothetical protein
VCNPQIEVPKLSQAANDDREVRWARSRTTLFLEGASDAATWLDFAGDRFQAAVGRHLSRRLGSEGAVSADALSVRFHRPAAEGGTAQPLVALQGAVHPLVAVGDDATAVRGGPVRGDTGGEAAGAAGGCRCDS